MNKNAIVLPSLLFFLLGSRSQTLFHSLSIPVEKGNTYLTNAWSGGLDAPQFSPADLNGDGKNDLFVFDRNNHRSYAFIQQGNGTYRYSAQISSMMPEMENWALMRDFNKDGVPDIFCFANSGMKVYRGKRIQENLVFEKISDLLTYTDYYSLNYPKINIYVLTDDIPGIVDVNGDGDIDVLAFGNLLNPSVPQYYENQSAEQGFGSDSLIFDSYNLDQCWGQFMEAPTTNAILIGACKTGGINASGAGRHAGSTLCPFDEDGDGDMDLLLGDITYNTMIMLRNSGDSSSANITSYDSIFPKYNVSIDIPIFPAAYITDADNDGKNDLLVAPNARTGYRNVKNVLFYKNIGNNINYVFRYQTDSFLVNTQLDFGSHAKVSVFDYNGDGLMDIIIGNKQMYLRQGQLEISTLALLENVGTPTSPSFKLVTTDFENISQYQLKELQPSFGDLDGDGKADMLLGDWSGYLHFFKNTGTNTAKFSSLTTPNFFNIDASVLSAPFIYDVDGDGDNDIVCGRRDGTLNWYINFGTPQNPQFSSDSVILKWGKINLTGFYEIEGCSQPVIRKENGSLFLYSGSNRGSVFKFLIPNQQLRSDSFLLVDSNFLKTYVGRKSTVAIADFNGDELADVITGNASGGIDFFSSKQIDQGINDLPEETAVKWSIFPNPATWSFSIITESNQLNSLEVFSITGVKVLEKTFFKKEEVSTHHWAAGTYLVKLHHEIKRLIVLK